MTFPERGNWKQLIGFVAQWTLMFIGADALMGRHVTAEVLFVGAVSGFVLGIAPRYFRSRAPRRPPAAGMG